MIALLPFLSGLAALVYEVLWFRRLGLVLGNTVEAAATVMAAYMLGLAIGAHVAGRRAALTRHPARVFGLLEVGIGLYALAVPGLLELARLPYVALYRQLPAASPWLTAIRFVLSAAVLLPPTCLMGATLPVLAQAVLARRRDFGGRLGLLYGMNTAGAVTGTVLAGFCLLPLLGLHGANAVAVAVSLSVGLSAILLDRRRPLAEPPAGAAQPAPPAACRTTLLLAALGLSGFLALAFEVAWFRTLILVFGSTTYSFTVMLAVFLLGLSLGSLVAGRLSDCVRRPIAVYAGAIVLVGLFTLLSLYGFTRVPELFLDFLRRAGLRWPTVIAAKTVIATVFLLLPAMGFGAAFAAGTRAVRESVSASPRAVGAACTVNTVGAALGAVSAGFVLLPRLGIELTLFTLARYALVLGAAAALPWGRANGRGWAARHAAALVLVLAAVAPAPRWDRQVLVSGPYFAPWNFLRAGAPGLKAKIASQQLLHYDEGRTAVVAVTRGPDQKLYFSMDGKVEADTTERSMVLQRMMGHLPMLFHPDPRGVLNIGFGAGVTLGALNCHRPDRIEVVDIEPRVRAAARTWGKLNHYVTDDPRIVLTVNDGRNHLLAARRRYDVIASDPFEPVVAGAASLYTVEHFRQARARLRPEGLMCQYLPLYELSRHDFEVILRSFATVFPHCAVFFTGCDAILLGARDTLTLDLDRAQRRLALPAVRNSLRELGFREAADILGMLVLHTENALELVGPGPCNTDDRPRIEFSAPRAALRYTSDENQRLLLDMFQPLPEPLLAALPEASRELAVSTRGALRMVLRLAVEREPGRPPEEAVTELTQAASLAPRNPIVRNEKVATLCALATWHLSQGRPAPAAEHLRRAHHASQGGAFWPVYYLTQLALQADDLARAGQYVDQGLAHYPDSPLLLALRARVQGLSGDPATAALDLRQALDALPRRPRFWEDYAACLDALDQPAEAEQARRRAARWRRWLEN